MKIHLAIDHSVDKENLYSLPEVIEALVEAGFDLDDTLDMANQIGEYWAERDRDEIISKNIPEMFIPPMNA